MNRAIIDLETGGFSITKNGVCEIGVIIIDENYNVQLHQNNWIIKPYKRPDSDEIVSYKDDAMAIHGITMSEIENGFDVKFVCESLISYLNCYQVKTLIGHNIKLFDNPRLKYLVERFTVHQFDFDILDTLDESKKIGLNLESYSLESLCKHYGITNNDSHRALGDCYATLELLKKFGL